MAILYPIYNRWNELIFHNKIFLSRNNKTIVTRKCFEFRTRLPKNLTTGIKVYIYEPARYGGCRKVVGEFTVGNIIRTDYHIGCYAFLPYFCENILNKPEYAEKFEKALRIDIPNYKKGVSVEFALCPECFNYLVTNHKWPPFSMSYAENSEYKQTQEIIRLCDDWLMKMGFYNEYGESNYQYAYEILNPVLYDNPKPLSDFQKLDGAVLTKAPQSFVYVQEN